MQNTAFTEPGSGASVAMPLEPPKLAAYESGSVADRLDRPRPASPPCRFGSTQQ